MVYHEGMNEQEYGYYYVSSNDNDYLKGPMGRILSATAMIKL